MAGPKITLGLLAVCAMVMFAGCRTANQYWNSRSMGCRPHWDGDMIIGPLNGHYYAYSIEELGAV